MANTPYYKQKFETLEYPERLSGVVTLTQTLFEHQEFYDAQSLSDSVSVSSLRWQKGADRLAINMVDDGLIIAIEHGKLNDRALRHAHEPSLLSDYRRATLAISLGEASTYFSNPNMMNTQTDAAISPGVNKLGPYWKRYDYIDEFLLVRNHAFGRLGLNWAWKLAA